MTARDQPHRHSASHRPGRAPGSSQPTGGALAHAIDRVTRNVLRHWLLVANLLVVLGLAAAVAAPVLRAVGAEPVATALYLILRPVCLQRPSHSFAILGYPMALEHRMLAMGIALLIGGLSFGHRRWPVGRVDWRLVGLLMVPLIWDVASQAVGLRSSDWLTRSWTGGLATLAAVAWLYPVLDRDLGGWGDTVASTRK